MVGFVNYKIRSDSETVLCVEFNNAEAKRGE